MAAMHTSLKQFYGLEARDPVRDSQDIDSPHFQAREFFEESLRTDSLQQLMAKEQSLVSDIQSFDSDLQTLVYDNYSKFLGASDTVDSLSDNIATMTEKMNRLRENLTGVARHSDEIEADLQPNRQKIQRLVGISRLLERVEFISKLPSQLRACLNGRRFSVAVNVWTKVEGILSTQQHFPSFKRIHEECQGIMEDIRAKIRWQMLNMDVSVVDSIDYAVLLVKLKTPLITVCSQLAHHWFLVIDNTLESSDLPEEPFSALSQLNKVAIDECSLFVKLYREKLCAVELSEVEKVKVDGVLTEFANNTFERITQMLSIESLCALDCGKIGSYISLFEDLIAPIASKQQVSKYFYRVLKAYTAAKTSRVYENMLVSSKGKRGVELYEYETTQFIGACRSLVSEFQVLVMMDHGECAHFLIQEISLMFEKVFEFFQTSDPGNGLVYHVVTHTFREKSIPQLFEQFASLEHDSPLQSLEGKIEEDCRNVGKACLSRFVDYQRHAASAIIADAILSRKWLDHVGDPTGPSQKVRDFIEYVQTLTTEVTKLLAVTQPSDTSENDSPKWQKRTLLQSSSLYSMPTEPTFCGVREEGIGQIDRLFMSVNRLQLNRPLQSDTPSIVSSVIIYSVKTALELVRLTRFSNHGFNQIQVDGYALYSAFRSIVAQADLFAALIEEFISSACDRTLEPIPLDVTILTTLV